MKTAMQQTIETLNKLIRISGNDEYKAGIERSISEIEINLPKERKQIERAYEQGDEDCSRGKFGGVSQYKSSSDYFTQTYKP